MKKQRSYTKEELKNSKRIYKSVTPKFTIDWYIKWVGSIALLSATSLRGIEGLHLWDLWLSIFGVSLWLIVSVMWKDRALILLNGVGLLFLLRNVIQVING